jgi:hypothetical protein
VTNNKNAQNIPIKKVTVKDDKEDGGDFDMDEEIEEGD